MAASLNQCRFAHLWVTNTDLHLVGNHWKFIPWFSTVVSSLISTRNKSDKRTLTEFNLN